MLTKTDSLCHKTHKIRFLFLCQCIWKLKITFTQNCLVSKGLLRQKLYLLHLIILLKYHLHSHLTQKVAQMRFLLLYMKIGKKKSKLQNLNKNSISNKSIVEMQHAIRLQSRIVGQCYLGNQSMRCNRQLLFCEQRDGLYKILLLIRQGLSSDWFVYKMCNCTFYRLVFLGFTQYSPFLHLASLLGSCRDPSTLSAITSSVCGNVAVSDRLSETSGFHYHTRLVPFSGVSPLRTAVLKA